MSGPRLCREDGRCSQEMTLIAARRDFVSRAWALQVPGGLVPYRRSGSARTMRGQVRAQTRTV